MNLYDFLLIASASLYATEVLTRRSGPYNMFGWIREKVPMGGLTTCSWCAVIWISGVMTLLYFFLPQAVWVFSVAGAAMMLRSYTGVNHG